MYNILHRKSITIQSLESYANVNQQFNHKIYYPKIIQNLILTAPPDNSYQIQYHNKFHKQQNLINFNKLYAFNQCDINKCKSALYLAPNSLSAKQQQNNYQKMLGSKKYKRDGENIRTYARYDTIIQILQQQLIINKIITQIQYEKYIVYFQMKSKRSLQRFFFYLILAKKVNKLPFILISLKSKIFSKIQQKNNHRTQQFINNLQKCIHKYLNAAQLLQQANTLQQAKIAFNLAYLNDLPQNYISKKPHHNQIKGIDKCIQIYQIIMEKTTTLQHPATQQEQAKVRNLSIVKLEYQNMQKNQISISKNMHQEKQQIKAMQTPQTRKRSYYKQEDQSYSILEQLQQNPNQKKKKIGQKNEKHDDRDIQKYAKFDIIRESSLQFIKRQKLQKNISQLCKKLSQRSLHYYFVILALIQKQKKQKQFVCYLQSNYQKTVHKRYEQRSKYFKNKLYSTFQNLINATKKLFQGNLQDALIIAYQVKVDKKPHPAKASQQKKCKQIYKAAKSYLQEHIEQDKAQKHQIENSKPHSDQAIKDLSKHDISQISNIQIPTPITVPLTLIQPDSLLNLRQQQKIRCELQIGDTQKISQQHQLHHMLIMSTRQSFSNKIEQPNIINSNLIIRNNFNQNLSSDLKQL